MTKKDHLQKLRTLAEDPTLLGNGVGISLNTNGFWYGWKLNNSDNLASSHYSFEVDSIEDAIWIIHEFSNEDKKKIRENLGREGLGTGNLYLHCIKRLR